MRKFPNSATVRGYISIIWRDCVSTPDAYKLNIIRRIKSQNIKKFKSKFCKLNPYQIVAYCIELKILPLHIPIEWFEKLETVVPT